MEYFKNIEPSLYSRNKPYIGMVYNSFYMLPNSIC